MGDSTSRAITPVEIASQFPARGFGPLEPLPGRAVHYAIDPTASRVEFSVTFFRVLTVRGVIPGLSGEIRYHTADPRCWSAVAELPMRGVDTRLRLRDAHLRSRDYLDVARFPLAVFRTSAIERQTRELWVHGMLSLRDQTKPIVMRFGYPDRPRREGNGREVVETTGRVTLDRRQFGILGHDKGGFRLDPRDVTIGNLVGVTIFIRAIRIESIG